MDDQRDYEEEKANLALMQEEREEDEEYEVIPPPKTFTCNDCGTQGTLRWMDQHPCESIRDVDEFGGRCEDYPACGHIGADAGCAPQESHTSAYWHDVFARREAMGIDFMDPMYDDLG